MSALPAPQFGSRGPLPAEHERHLVGRFVAVTVPDRERDRVLTRAEVVIVASEAAFGGCVPVVRRPADLPHGAGAEAAAVGLAPGAARTAVEVQGAARRVLKAGRTVRVLVGGFL